MSLILSTGGGGLVWRGACMAGGMCGKGVCAWQEGMRDGVMRGRVGRGLCMAGETATAAGGTHPKSWKNTQLI